MRKLLVIVCYALVFAAGFMVFAGHWKPAIAVVFVAMAVGWVADRA